VAVIEVVGDGGEGVASGVGGVMGWGLSWSWGIGSGDSAVEEVIGDGVGVGEAGGVAEFVDGCGGWMDVAE
jgi:hypothetical protein